MADNGQIDVGFGLDASQANGELRRLDTQLKELSTNLLQAQKVIETRTTKMVKDLSTAMAQVNKGTAQYSRTVRSLESDFGRSMGSASRGGYDGQQRDTAARAVIADARNAADQVTARVTNELVNQFSQKLRTMDNMVAARLRAETARTSRFQSQNTPDMLAARQVLDQRRQGDVMFEANNGRAALQHRNTMERFNANGGANIMAVQSRVLANFAALSMAYNSLRETATFVVQLDSEFHQFQAITAASSAEMVGLKDRLIEVSEVSKFTALEVAQAATIMGQAGLSAKQVADSVGSVATLATAAGTSLAEAVDVVTSTMSIFNLQTSQTADVANTLTSALNLSKLTIDKVALGLQYSGNIAADVGITYQELTAALGAMSNAGIRSGSTLGTGLRQLLIDIQNPTAKFTAILKQLGLTQEDVNVESNGLINVLNTMKAAGFGTAEALAAFEVRAASAYSALSNNTDLAADLQQQFTLSNAAIEANAIQMESLANTWAKWQSVFGTVVYKTFEPFIRVLQKAVNGLADFFAVLNSHEQVLRVAGGLFAGLVTYGTLAMFGALVRGVWMMVPAFSGVTTAVAGTTGAFAALRVAMLAHPILLIIGTLTTIITLMNSFGQGTASTAEKIDALKARVNGFKGEIEETNNELEAINGTIDNLIKQRAALDSNPLMRQAKIAEVKQQFTDLYGEVETTTATVEDLINALHRLATQDFGHLGDKIAEAVAAELALIQGYEIKIAEDTRKGGTDLMLGQRRDFLDNLTDDQQYELHELYTSGNQGYMERLGEYLVASYTKQFGERVGNAAAAAIGKVDLTGDPSEASGILAAVNTTKMDLQRESEDLRQQRTISPLSNADEERLNSLPSQIEMLSKLYDTLQPVVAGILNVAQSNNTLDGLQRQQRANQVHKSPNYQSLNKATVDLRSEITGELREIGKNAVGKTTEEVLNEYRALENTYKDRVQALKDQLASLVSEFPEFEEGQVQEAASELFANVANLGFQIGTKLSDHNKIVAKIHKEIYEDDVAVIDRDIMSAMRAAAKSNDQAEITRLSEYIAAEYDKKRALLDKIYEAEVAIAGPDADTSDLTSGLRKAKNDLARDEQDRQQTLAGNRVDAQVRDLDDLKSATDEEIRVHRAKIKEVIDAIKKSRPGAAMDGLIEQYNELATQMGLLQSQSSILGIQSANLSDTGNINLGGTQSEKATRAMQMFIQMGYSQAQAAGIVGNLLTENSAMDPTNNTGDGGKAFGLAQWHPDRQAKLDKYVADFGGRRDDFDTQIKFIDYELRTYEKSAHADLMKQLTAGGAADSFRRNYERPHLDPDKGHHQRRIQYANAMVNGGFSTANQSNIGLDTDFTNAVDQANTNAQRTSTNTQVKTSNQLIAQMMTQAKGLTDPAAVKSIIDSVDAEFTKVIQARTALFNQENADELAAGNPDILAERDTVLQGIRADQQTKVATLMDEYYAAAEKKIEEPLKEAQAALAAAQAPGMEGKFSSNDLAQLQGNVNLAEREVQMQRAIVAEQALLQVQQQRAAVEAQFGAGSSEATFWMNEEIRAKERLVELTREKNALEAASAQSSISLGNAIQSANNQWAVQAGLMRQNAQGMYEMVPLAEQVGNAWGQILNGMTTGFSTLFKDLVSGTMTAEEAFKKFALSVIQMFIEMIAQALAYQIVSSFMGGGKGGGGGGGDFMGNMLMGLFGSPGMALGGGVRGAATGEMISGGIPNRDSVLRKVMPGEFIMRQSAVKAIGEDKLTGLNNLGNRKLSQSGITPLSNQDQAAGGGVVNVWVVSPDEQPQQMGPNDVIATVANNIQRRGSLKQLIKQVQMGVV